jgi:hypothetical protein
VALYASPALPRSDSIREFTLSRKIDPSSHFTFIQEWQGSHTFWLRLLTDYLFYSFGLKTKHAEIP